MSGWSNAAHGNFDPCDGDEPKKSRAQRLADALPTSEALQELLSECEQEDAEIAESEANAARNGEGDVS